MAHLGGIFGGTGNEGGLFKPLTPDERTAILGGTFQPGALVPSNSGKLTGGSFTTQRDSSGDDPGPDEGPTGAASPTAPSEVDESLAIGDLNESRDLDLGDVANVAGKVAGLFGKANPFGLAMSAFSGLADATKARSLANRFGMEPETNMFGIPSLEKTQELAFTIALSAFEGTFDPFGIGPNFDPTQSGFNFGDDSLDDPDPASTGTPGIGGSGGDLGGPDGPGESGQSTGTPGIGGSGGDVGGSDGEGEGSGGGGNSGGSEGEGGEGDAGSPF